MILPFSFLQNRLLAMIPIMTSNTAPSGTCSAIDGSSTAWQAFTPNVVDGWQSSNVGINWIQYKFPRLTNCSKLILTFGQTAGGSSTLTLSGSLDGVTFVNLVAFVISGLTGTNTVTFSNNTQYFYYRLTTQNNISVTFDAIQLYGF